MVRDDSFEDSLQILFPQWQQAEEFIAAAEVVLAVDAEIGTPLGNGIWILPMAPVKGAEVWLYYTFYETVVVLFEVVSFQE